MDKNYIQNILSDWNFWQNAPDTGHARIGYLDQLGSLLGTHHVVVVTGVRRAGKSYLMRQMIRTLIEKGTDKKNTLFVNFEDPRLPRADTSLLEKIYGTYCAHLKPNAIPYLFLDEIQEVIGWEKWVRMMHELGKARIVISGSNARLLSGELAGVLTGRHVDVTVFPLSFEEFLSFKRAPSRSLPQEERNIVLRQLLDEYMEHGGFPEIVLRPQQRMEIVRAYLEDIQEKDIAQRYRVRKTEQVKELARYYFTNVGRPVTFTGLEKHFHISADTIEKFTAYFENAYIFFMLKRFSYKVKEQGKSPRKIYAVDNGLANFAGFKFSPDTGFGMENLVFLHLKRYQAMNPTIELYYWKDVHGKEVDFVVKQGAKVKALVQVCCRTEDIYTRTRELKALQKAMDEFRTKNAIVITGDNREGEEHVSSGTVNYVPLHQWLLRQEPV
jgi:predicted AAA+ superfamily ATPase